MGHHPLVFINKVDRPNADPARALDKTLDLFIELGANDEQCDFSVLYGSGLDGWAVRDLDKDPRTGLAPLFETIVERVPAPLADGDAPFLMQVCALDYSDYLGRLASGRILQGRADVGAQVQRVRTRWTDEARSDVEIAERLNGSLSGVFAIRGLDRTPLESAEAGEIIWISGIEDLSMGDVIAAPGTDESALLRPPLDIEPPTVSMFFLVNTSPFAGKEGKAATLRQIRERLTRAARTDVALKIEDLGRPDGLKVSGRGELHLSILVEEMRREGFEFCVSRPEVITFRDTEGRLREPFEELVVEVPEAYQGAVIQMLAPRKAEMTEMRNAGTGVLRMLYHVPTRGLFGLRSDFLTETRGLGIMTSRFVEYAPWAGEIPARNRGALVSVDDGIATSYSLENLQERGHLFVEPGDPVYCGMVVGESSRGKDLPCNPAKSKAATNIRSATKDTMIILDVPLKLDVDYALAWIADDEWAEITPKSVRIRKTILDADQRKKAARRAKADSEEAEE
jgi:GTP-binding protein